MRLINNHMRLTLDKNCLTMRILHLKSISLGGLSRALKLRNGSGGLGLLCLDDVDYVRRVVSDNLLIRLIDWVHRNRTARVYYLIYKTGCLYIVIIKV